MFTRDSVSKLQLVGYTPFCRELNGESFGSRVSSIVCEDEKKYSNYQERNYSWATRYKQKISLKPYRLDEKPSEETKRHHGSKKRYINGVRAGQVRVRTRTREVYTRVSESRIKNIIIPANTSVIVAVALSLLVLFQSLKHAVLSELDDFLREKIDQPNLLFLKKHLYPSLYELGLKY